MGQHSQPGWWQVPRRKRTDRRLTLTAVLAVAVIVGVLLVLM